MTKRRLKGWKAGSINYYEDLADAGFWDEHWNVMISTECYRNYGKGSLDEYPSISEKYFHIKDHILEAGCGTAKHVVALKLINSSISQRNNLNIN